MASYFLSADDPLFAELAQQLLHWHNASGHEDNIKIAVRDFLTRTGLTEPYDIVAEGKPGKLSRKRVDLVLTDALIEVKKSIWSARSSSVPHAPYVEQIDGYIAQSPPRQLGNPHRRPTLAVAHLRNVERADVASLDVQTARR